MRIVAGTARGQRLEGPKGPGIRPTSDRVRESLFNVLGQWLPQVAVLDLYAGTGALALEAISRGAARAVLVDRDREAVRLCTHNARALGFSAQVTILALPVERALRELSSSAQRFELVFADPPYAQRVVAQTLSEVEAAGVLAPGATVCIEHDRREEAPQVLGGMAREDQRRFGDTVVSLYRAP